MPEKYVYMVEFKKGKWKQWNGLTPAESLDAAQSYINTFYPAVVYWYERKGVYYARRRLDNGKLITYRITRHTMVTEEEVALIQERRAARRAAMAEGK